MSLSGPGIAIIAFATVFALLNGAKDGANSLATIITSRSMAPYWAIAIVVSMQLAGPFIFGVEVAKTVGSGIAEQHAITPTVVLAALVSATSWNGLMWRLSLPTSSSHALIGGIVGAILAGNGLNFGLLHAAGLLKVAGGLFLTPLVAVLAGYLVMGAATFLLRGASPRAVWFFRRGQVVTTASLALSFGANDSPKAMGMITMGLLALGAIQSFEVPIWTVWLSASALALGTFLGGWRMVRTIGTRFYRVRPLHAFNSQLTASLLVLSASLAGAPVSTSQVVSSSIVGVGAAERLTRVRWGVLGEIVMGWLLTIPAAGVAGGLIYLLLSQWLGR